MDPPTIREMLAAETVLKWMSARLADDCKKHMRGFSREEMERNYRPRQALIVVRNLLLDQVEQLQDLSYGPRDV